MNCLYCGRKTKKEELCKLHEKDYKILTTRWRYWNKRPRGFGLEVVKNILTTDQNIIIKAPRGVGKSVLADLIAIDLAVHNKDFFILISSVGFDRSKEHIREIRSLLKGTLFTNYITEESKEHIAFENGSRILAIPQSEETRVGYHPHIKIIDELSRMKDSFYWGVLSPMGRALNAREIIISTPYGTSGVFKELWDLDNTYLKFNINIGDCWWISEDQIKRERIRMPSKFFKQEILGEFIDSEKQVFPPQLLRECINHYDIDIKKELIMGIDFGRKKDFTAVVLLSVDGEVYFTYTTQKNWQQQFKEIEKIYTKYNIVETIADATGVGDVIVDNISVINPEPFIITQNSKKQAIDNLVLLMEQRQIKIRSDFKELLSQLELFNYLDDKFVKAEASRGHDDLVIALMLAAWKLQEEQYEENAWESYV